MVRKYFKVLVNVFTFSTHFKFIELGFESRKQHFEGIVFTFSEKILKNIIELLIDYFNRANELCTGLQLLFYPNRPN